MNKERGVENLFVWIERSGGRGLGGLRLGVGCWYCRCHC